MNQKGVKTKGKKVRVMSLIYNIHIQYNKCTYIYTFACILQLSVSTVQYKLE